MSTHLAKSLHEVDRITGKPIDFTDPSRLDRFFSQEERNKIDLSYKDREAPAIGNPFQSCSGNLFLGFFFDGTRNNYALSEQAKDYTHSNVARLFDAYPGQTIAPALLLRHEVRWPNESKYPNYFRIYTPGVGTPFEEVNDTGSKRGGLLSDATQGAAMARWGERRLTWALVQAINSIHRYFLKQSLLTPDETLRLCKTLDLDTYNLQAAPRTTDYGQPGNTMAHLEQALRRLHTALKPHMPDPVTGKVGKIDPGVVKHIYVSMFGFSRGSAAARSFLNWFLALCKLDAKILGRQGPTLGGFPVTVDFLGLFDTVASVGLASSALITDGHGAWADSKLLRVPQEINCLHLVSAHELRRSFPLDSISINGALAANHQEIVFPGVHSDLGGGYMPTEQGRGRDAEGADMISRIPLAVMYRAARLAGAPLKLELAPQLRKRGFKVAPQTISDFNAYISQCLTKSGSLRAIMHEQMEHAIRWRRRWHNKMEQMPSVSRAKPEDTNDIVGADQEFGEEIKMFEAWRKQPERTVMFCPNLFVCVETKKSTVPGVDPDRAKEWGEFVQFWDKPVVPTEIAKLFEEYIHDSRAWFKLTGLEAAEVEGALKKWVREYQALKATQKYNPTGLGPRSKFSTEEIAWIEEYQRTGKIPRMKTSGREPMELGAGYLRWRRIYAGDDHLRLTQNQERQMDSAATT